MIIQMLNQHNERLLYQQTAMFLVIRSIEILMTSTKTETSILFIDSTA